MIWFCVLRWREIELAKSRRRDAYVNLSTAFGAADAGWDADEAADRQGQERRMARARSEERETGRRGGERGRMRREEVEEAFSFRACPLLDRQHSSIAAVFGLGRTVPVSGSVGFA